MRNTRSLIKPLLLIVFSLLLVSSCYSSTTQKNNSSLGQLSIVPECRVVQHKLGEICIPAKPQRIIALDPRFLTDPLLALSIEPIGTAVYDHSLAGLSPSEIAGVKTVGDTHRPSLEKILTLKPDLILAIDFAHEQIYEHLSVIAPTVLVKHEKNSYFKQNFQYIAQLIGREEAAEVVLNQYQNRIEELKKRIGNQLQKMEVSVVFYHHNGFGIMPDSSTSSQIFTDIGLRHKTASLSNILFSIEEINKYDADVLFIQNDDEKPASFYFQNPLISSLKAVQNGRAYIVDHNIWDGNGPLGVNRILDDLFRYLPEGE